MAANQLTPEEKKERELERCRLKSAKWRAENPEAARALNASRKEYKHQHYLKNRAKVIARTKQWQNENREKYRKQSTARVTAWNRAHPQEARAKRIKWWKNNPHQHKTAERRGRNAKAAREYAARNPEKHKAHARNRRARQKAAAGRHSGADIIRLFELQRGLCASCSALISKNKGAQKYHVDHIVPLAPRRGFEGGSNWPSNLQLLCAACNRKKNNLDPKEWEKIVKTA